MTDGRCPVKFGVYGRHVEVVHRLFGPVDRGRHGFYHLAQPFLADLPGAFPRRGIGEPQSDHLVAAVEVDDLPLGVDQLT